MKYYLESLILFLIYGVAYYLIEVAFRGHSDLAMFVVGGVCGVAIGLINEVFTYETSLIVQGLIGMMIVTSIEFITGYILNVRMGLGIWDYSSLPFNIMGQVCLLFSCYWFLLSILVVVIDDFLRERLFGERREHYRI